MTPLLVCKSLISSVTVFARGAIVKRRVTLAEALPVEACDVVVENVTSLCDVGSLRATFASADDGREVLGVVAKLVVPEPKKVDASRSSQVDEQRRRHESLVTARNHASWRRDVLASVQPEPELFRRVRAINPAERMLDALSVVRLAFDEMAALDAKIAELSHAITESEREIEKLQVALAQSSERGGHRDTPPTISIVTRLGPQKQGPQPQTLEVEYAVMAARWWPTYRARFTDSATRAELTLSALVAQASGEDWDGVKLTLSTGDLLRDARLPELASLRLGRAQRPRARGYRPPPEGLDKMFEGFDRFVTQVSVATTITTSVTTGLVSRDEGQLMQTPSPHKTPPSEYELDSLGSPDDLDEPTAVAMLQELPRERRAGRPRPAAGAQPPPQGMSMPQQNAPAPMAPMMMAPGFGGGASHAMKGEAVEPVARGKVDLKARLGRAAVMEDAGRSADGTLGEGMLHHEPLPIEPTDAWLDFDSLRLDPKAVRERRGRLMRDVDPSHIRLDAAARIIERLDPPSGATDPRASRGLFDAVYFASGKVDVPSVGRPHRVTITSREAPSTPRFVTVPREAAEVYRRADVVNPFGVPLLTGPVEVLIDGALVALARLSYTDRGGVLSIGLGVEERIRVARNTKIEEGTAGLLGGSTTVDHSVTIDLQSALGRSIKVEILDRVPVSDEKDVEVKFLSSQPQAAAYSQADLGHPMRKGQRWVVDVPASGKAKAEWKYRVTLPSKMEVIGGNRRE